MDGRDPFTQLLARLKVPGNITPEGAWEAAHGVRPGIDACPSCQRVYEHTDAVRCPCGRPLPITCPFCNQPAQPQWFERTGWQDPIAPCCYDKQGRNSSAKDRVKEALPADLVHHLQQGYQQWPHRSDVDRVVGGWLDNQCRGSLYIWGPKDTGKSVAAARAASQAVLRGHLNDFTWMDWLDLVMAAKGNYKDPEVFERLAPSELVTQARTARLLVVDNFLYHGQDGMRALSAGARVELGHLKQKRLEQGRPTIWISIRPPNWQRWDSHKLGSAFANAAAIVTTEGSDT